MGWEYNWDDGTVDMKLAGGTTIKLLCRMLERGLGGSPLAMGKLEAMKIETPEEYARLALTGTIAEYLESIDAGTHTVFQSVCENLRRTMPELTDTQIRAIAREMQMEQS